MDEREQKRLRIAIAVVAGIGVLGLGWDLLRRTGAEHDAPKNAGPTFTLMPKFVAAPKGKYPFCDEIGDFWKKKQEELGCPWKGMDFGRAICELTYRERQNCAPLYEKAVACIRALPATSWSCDPKDSVKFKDGDCANELAPLQPCLEP
jgi:hypothetical protein